MSHRWIVNVPITNITIVPESQALQTFRWAGRFKVMYDRQTEQERSHHRHVRVCKECITYRNNCYNIPQYM